MIAPTQRFRTSNLNNATFIHSQGTPLVGTEFNGSVLEFIFDIDQVKGREHEAAFHNGQAVPANTIFASLKVIRSLIHQHNAGYKNSQGATFNARPSFTSR
jgi:hypothetical protein